MTQAEVFDKVRKLLRLAGNNPNAEEAALAAAKAQQLIDRHKLSQALLELDAPEEEPIIDFGTKNAPLDEGKQNDRWRWALAFVVMRANACRGYMDQGNLHIIGRPSDVNTVRYLYSYLKEEIQRLVRRDALGTGKTWTNNYRLGVIDTIARKFAEQKQAMQAEVRAEAAPGALVKVENALARLEAKAAEVDEWVKNNRKFVTKQSKLRADYSARMEGRKAGEEISLNRAKGGLGSGHKMLASQP